MTRVSFVCLVLCMAAGSLQAQTAPEYDVNSPSAHMTVDGLLGSASIPAVTNLTAYACGPTVSPATGTIFFNSNLGPAGAFELAISTANAAPASNGGTVFSTGQILNLSFNSLLLFLNGGFLPAFVPLPPVPASVTFSRDQQVDVTLQAIVAGAGLPGGFDLTQPCEVHVGIAPPVTTLAGPTGNNSAVVLNLTSGPNCWAPGGFPLFGTLYTQMYVSSNGRVTFNMANNTGVPSVLGAMTGPPFAGFWADFNPVLGATINISQTSLGAIRIDYNNVIYGNLGGTSSIFHLEFEPVSGQIEIGGLQGIANPFNSVGQFVGISPGNQGPATDPGSVVFTPGGFGATNSPNEMLYDFGPSPLASLAAGVSQIFIVPAGSAYTWAAL